MGNIIDVKNIDFNLFSQQNYDIFIYALGYESRALFIASEYKAKATVNIVDSFTQNKKFEFENNYNWYYKNNFYISQFDSKSDLSERVTLLNTICKEKFKKKSSLKIGIDISSLSRDRIAKWYYTFIELSNHYSLEIDSVYSYGEYYEPDMEDAPIIHFGPVISHFAGWTDDPNLPNSLILGIGFEPNRAIGVWERLDTSIVYAFVPIGPFENFNNAINKSNESLFKQIIYPRNHCFKIEYEYNNILNTFNNLESVVYGCKQFSRPILLPLGPKIFSVLSIIVTIIHLPNVSLWRVSGGELEKPINRIATGEVTGINFTLDKINQSNNI